MRTRRILGIVLCLGALAGGLLLAAGTQPPAITTDNYGMLVRRASTYVDARVLVANTAETVTIPTFSGEPNARVVVVYKSNSACPDYYVNVTETATVPGADVTNGSASEGNPAALNFAQGTTFSVVAPTACTLTFAMHLGNA